MPKPKVLTSRVSPPARHEISPPPLPLGEDMRLLLVVGFHSDSSEDEIKNVFKEFNTSGWNQFICIYMYVTFI
jgi:hypothetical protein